MKVGIFFFVDGHVIMDAAPVERGKAVGDAIQYGNDYQFWKTLHPTTATEHSFKQWPYYAFPRGKVVYIPGERVFRVYADPCLKRKDIESVVKQFGRENAAVDIGNDELYQCYKCNKYFHLFT